MKIVAGNPIHLIADDGLMLTNGDVVCKEVWLGNLDSPENWHEVPADEEPEQGE